MSLDCNQTKERLEALIDQIVDAGLIGQEIDPNQLSLTSDCQQHLSQCANCRDYQVANRMLIEAAAALPIAEVPQADLLTASIMQAVMDEPMPAISALVKNHMACNDKINTETMQIQSNTYSEISLVALSFVAFALASAYGVQLDESLWNIGSWLIALVVFIAIKPLIEQGQLNQRPQSKGPMGTPA